MMSTMALCLASMVALASFGSRVARVSCQLSGRSKGVSSSLLAKSVNKLAMSLIWAKLVSLRIKLRRYAIRAGGFVGREVTHHVAQFCGVAL